MKLFLFILCLVPVVLQAQEATIKIKSYAQHRPIAVLKPVEGNYFVTSTNWISRNEQGEYLIENDLTTAGAVEIVLDRRIYLLYVQPGKSYEIMDSRFQFLKIVADDAEGQLELQMSVRPEAYQDKARQMLSRDRGFKYCYWKLQSECETQLLVFKRLLRKNKITPGFYDYTQRLITLYYACVMADIMRVETRELVYDPKEKGYSAEKLEKAARRWKEILQFCNVSFPKNRVARNYNIYFSLINGLYYGGFLPSVAQQRLIIPTTQHAYIKNTFATIEKHYPEEPLKEYLLASMIAGMIQNGESGTLILEAEQYFEKLYPASIYLPYILPGAERVKKFQEGVKARVSDKQLLIPQSDTISSLESLGERFRGKTVYLSLWSPNSNGSKQAFAYNDSLKNFLQDRGVEMVYIAMDEALQEISWKDMIAYLQLDGWHMQANHALMVSLAEHFGDGKQLHIPAHGLMKDGKLVETKAAWHDELDKLAEQLAEK
ncbi:hypothetical protein [uncultured Chitinophaga sp.]|uniref:hypothetical protein n=1 Tax=uncultured Chitinophaga sp. TaxID=339340 RepID=UPI0025F54AAD|nr:hypothetical protein [uncultured Chitinophaga sp.]